MSHYCLYCKQLRENRIVTQKYKMFDVIYSDIATKYKLDNLIDEEDDETFKNIKKVAEILSLVECHCILKKILSWYLKDSIIKISEDIKEHNTGYAVDFITENVDRDFDTLKENLPKYTRLIKETSGIRRIHLEYNGINDRIWFIL
jgi:uncharacterized protein YfbU (UPF0304 family)